MEMNSKDALKRTVDDLQKQAEEIEELGVKLLEEAPFMDAYPDGGFFKTLDYRSPLKKLQRETILKYQQWYSVALNLVDEYAPEWLEEFKLRYSSNKLQTSFYVMDCLRLDVYIRSNRDHIVAGFAIDWF